MTVMLRNLHVGDQREMEHPLWKQAASRAFSTQGPDRALRQELKNGKEREDPVCARGELTQEVTIELKQRC